LASYYSVIGLITAYLVANGAGQIYSSYYARKKFKVEFATPSLLKIFIVSGLSSVAPVLILNFAGFSTILSFVIGATLYLFSYLTLMPLTKIMSLPELQQVANVVQRTSVLAWIAKPVIAYQKKLLRFQFFPPREEAQGSYPQDHR
jgi:predicted membrane-bound spermidine synthase